MDPRVQRISADSQGWGGSRLLAADQPAVAIHGHASGQQVGQDRDVEPARRQPGAQPAHDRRHAVPIGEAQQLEHLAPVGSERMGSIPDLQVLTQVHVMESMPARKHAESAVASRRPRRRTSPRVTDTLFSQAKARSARHTATATCLRATASQKMSERLGWVGGEGRTPPATPKAQGATCTCRLTPGTGWKE
jgi:hypothetical protein